LSKAFSIVEVPDHVFRVGLRPDVWVWRGWETAGADGTFGHRWDDPESRYRVLYTSASPYSAYIEVLAQFRPDLEVLAALGQIEDEPDDPHAATAGVVTRAWCERRLLGKGLTDEVRGRMVVAGAASTITSLRAQLARLALGCGLNDINAAVLRLGDQRSFTQAVSRLIYESEDFDGAPFGGVAYHSLYADEGDNFAIFERDGSPFPVSHLERSDIDAKDADFMRACRDLGLRPE
jgi:hypothetical protein